MGFGLGLRLSSLPGSGGGLHNEAGAKGIAAVVVAQPESRNRWLLFARKGQELSFTLARDDTVNYQEMGLTQKNRSVGKINATFGSYAMFGLSKRCICQPVHELDSLSQVHTSECHLSFATDTYCGWTKSCTTSETLEG